MIVELIRDNRKIVDRITRQQIDEFINLLRSNKVRIILQYWDCFKMDERNELIILPNILVQYHQLQDYLSKSIIFLSQHLKR